MKMFYVILVCLVIFLVGFAVSTSNKHRDNFFYYHATGLTLSTAYTVSIRADMSELGETSDANTIELASFGSIHSSTGLKRYAIPIVDINSNPAFGMPIGGCDLYVRVADANGTVDGTSLVWENFNGRLLNVFIYPADEDLKVWGIVAK